MWRKLLQATREQCRTKSFSKFWPLFVYVQCVRCVRIWMLWHSCLTHIAATHTNDCFAYFPFAFRNRRTEMSFNGIPYSCCTNFCFTHSLALRVLIPYLLCSVYYTHSNTVYTVHTYLYISESIECVYICMYCVYITKNGTCIHRSTPTNWSPVCVRTKAVACMNNKHIWLNMLMFVFVCMKAVRVIRSIEAFKINVFICSCEHVCVCMK